VCRTILAQEVPTMDAQALLDEADAIHDADPARGAELLRGIDAASLPADQRPLYAFLLNHVFGEKLGDWTEAHTRQGVLQRTAGAPLPAVLHRHSAVAARLAGDASAAGTATQSLATAAGVSLEQAGDLVVLAATTLQVDGLAAAPAAQLARSALQALQVGHWQEEGPLDVPAAAQCNNLGSSLVDRPVADLADPALREALALAADRAQWLWQRAGDWVNHERAAYLCAMAASALGDADGALRHARAGLALIDANDTAGEQSVDRAFLGLEAAFALERLGRADEATNTRAAADALASAFNDAGLENWFSERVARNGALRAHLSGAA
jgi:hypothetical protein